MKSISVSKHTKLKIHTTMINPILLYGCETWEMTEQMESYLKTCERRILRNVCGPIKDQNGWRIRINDELQVMYRKPSIVTTIKVRKLE
jgi:hypothetical protein